MKKTVIVGFCLMLLGFLGGFVPQHSRVSQAMQENQELRQQLVATQRSETVNIFRNRAALLYAEVEKSNFSVASESASKLFTDLRAFTNQSADATLKQNLEDILSTRDSIIGGIAKADPAVAAQIRELFLKMQNIEPRDNSKN
jgi:hypothetical protein